MKRDEAIKIVRLNIDRQNGSMREALKELIPELRGCPHICATCCYCERIYGEYVKCENESSPFYKDILPDNRTCEYWEENR